MFDRLVQTFDDILEYIAPRNDNNREGYTHSNVTRDRVIHENPHGQDSSISEQEIDDEAFAKKLQYEEDRKREILRVQFDEEINAAANGHFCKKQRVMYHHRVEDAFYEAVIVGVHFDDGPNKPYYTIRYHQMESPESQKNIVLEKQTTPDRLSQLPWDEEKTWLIIK